MSAICVVCGHRLKREGIMSPTELKALRITLGVRAGLRGPISQADLARLLNISDRSIRNYLTGDRVIPAKVAQDARRLREESNQAKRSRNGIA